MRWIRQGTGLYSLGNHTYYITRADGSRTWEVRYGHWTNGKWLANAGTLREAKAFAENHYKIRRTSS